MDELALKESLIVTYENEGIIKTNNKLIKIIPAYKWLTV